MSFNINFEQRLQVRSNCCIVYDKYIGRKSTTATLHRRLNMKEQQQKAYSGYMTKGSQKRITKAVNLLVMLAKPKWLYSEVLGKDVLHKLSFITLTISTDERNLTAREAYDNLLKPFLQWLTKTKGVRHYIWKAELQKRGQIHYHITTTSFINWTEIRMKWNRLQSGYGLLDKYIEQHKHANPNSTDIHEVYKIDDVTSYLIKYIAKADSKEDKTTGKLWDCSQSLKQSKYPDYEVTNGQQAFFEALLKANILNIKHTDFCTILNIPKQPGCELLSQSALENYYKEILRIQSTGYSEDQSEEQSEVNTKCTSSSSG